MAEFSIFVATEDESRAREVIQGLQEALESVEQDDVDSERLNRIRLRIEDSKV